MSIILKKAYELKRELNLNNLTEKQVNDNIETTAFRWNKKTFRQVKNYLKKENTRIQAEKDQKPVKCMTITIEWKRSQIWGYNPKASVRGQYTDGTYFHKERYTCSGCGYDKESTVIGQIFNEFMKYALHARRELIESRKNIPYGINNYNGYFSYGKGVGTSCYYRIGEFLGGTFKNVSSGKSFDVYEFSITE